VEEALHKEAYKLEKKSSKTNARSTHKKPTNHQNHKKKSRQQLLSHKKPQKEPSNRDKWRTIVFKRSPKTQAKSGKNKLSESSEKKPTKVETNH
jgi:hypothetical protein